MHNTLHSSSPPYLHIVLSSSCQNFFFFFFHGLTRYSQRNIRPWLARRRVAERRREILDIALAADVPQDQLRLHLYQQIEVLRRVYIAAHDHRRVITAVQRLASAMPPRMPPAQSYFALCLDKCKELGRAHEGFGRDDQQLDYHFSFRSVTHSSAEHLAAAGGLALCSDW